VGKLETDGPYIDTLGAALTGFRTTASAVTATDLADGDLATLLIYKGTDGTPAANALVWAATWDNGNSRWTRVSELLSLGTISDEDDVAFYVVSDLPPIPSRSDNSVYALKNGAWVNITNNLIGTPT